MLSLQLKQKYPLLLSIHSYELPCGKIYKEICFPVMVFWVMTPCSNMFRYQHFWRALLPLSSGLSEWLWEGGIDTGIIIGGIVHVGQ
jgi:hypothetical protein